MDELGITDVHDSAKLIAVWAADVEKLFDELEKKLNEAYSLVERGRDHLHPDCDDGHASLDRALDLIDEVTSNIEDM